MAFNKSGTKLIAIGMGGALVEWDILTHKKRELGKIQAQRLFVYAAKVNQLFIQKEEDVTLLNLKDNDETLITKGQYESGSLSADGTIAVLSKGNKEFELWKLANDSFNKVKTVPTTLPVRNSISLSENGQLIAAAEGTYRDGEGHRTIIEVWDVNDVKQPLRVFNTGENLGVWNLVFSPDGTMLAVDIQLNAKSGIRVWNVKTGAQLLNKSGFEAYWTRALIFAPNNKSNPIKYLFSGDEEGNLRIWKIPGGESTFWVNYPTGIQSLAFSPNGEYLAVALWDTTIQILRWTSDE
ncbi:MAG: hypothetical protein OXD54_14985 [Candidatus Poribacteria bacterium]|nr:hypothetical protein [Candidatus Poribacteria bacterium]